MNHEDSTEQIRKEMKHPLSGKGLLGRTYSQLHTENWKTGSYPL